MAAVVAAAVRDAEGLAEGGVDAVMVENFCDVPFYPRRVPAVTVAAMTAALAEVRRRVSLPLGVNVLRNDGCSAMAIAATVGAGFIRVNVLVGARVTDQGLINGIAHDLLRLRRQCAADSVRILADVNVKHSAPTAARPLEDEVRDLIHRGGADAVIVSGRGTGQRTDVSELATVKAAAGECPVIVGSGVRAETVRDYHAHADGFIVGTALKHGGDVAAPVDADRVRQFMAALGRG
jgi:membrane complex biogenesis BtpA family protein